MSWHDELALEVAATFAALSGGYHWAKLEDAIHARQFAKQRVAAEQRVYYAWHKKRPEVRRQNCERQKARYRRTKQITVAVRGCLGCRKPFALTLARQRAKKSRYCSAACALRHRQVPHYRMGRESLTLRDWCSRYGQSKTAVWERMQRGLSLEQALTLAESRSDVIRRAWATRRAAKGKQQ